MIKRTAFANTKAAAWTQYPYGSEGAYIADVVVEGEYPTYSPVLGPDGRNLMYESRPPMGFDLKAKT